MTCASVAQVMDDIRRVQAAPICIIQGYPSEEDVPPWPLWVSRTANVSHLLLAVACSANFFIYYFKYTQAFRVCAFGGGRTRRNTPNWMK